MTPPPRSTRSSALPGWTQCWRPPGRGGGRRQREFQIRFRGFTISAVAAAAALLLLIVIVSVEAQSPTTEGMSYPLPYDPRKTTLVIR